MSPTAPLGAGNGDLSRGTGDKLSSARAQSAGSHRTPGMEMRTRSLERTERFQRAAGRPEKNAPAGERSGPPGYSRDPTTPGQQGAWSQPERALRVQATAAPPDFRYLGPPSLPTTRSLKGPRRKPGQKSVHTESL